VVFGAYFCFAIGSCDLCLTLFEDIDDAGDARKTYFQKSGTLTILSSADDLKEDLINATIKNAVLVEFDEYGPVADGACFKIVDKNLLIEPVEGWECPRKDFEDGWYCDCECGVWDPDCDFRAAPVNGCSLMGATCVEEDGDGVCEGGIEGWICDPIYYSDWECDCDCGIWDPDCDIEPTPVFGCSLAGATCVEEDGKGVCEGGVEGWTCDPSYYADGECECDCGIWDPDCDTDPQYPWDCGESQYCVKDKDGLPACSD